MAVLCQNGHAVLSSGHVVNLRLARNAYVRNEKSDIHSNKTNNIYNINTLLICLDFTLWESGMRISF
jgi:hypothetical protein